MTEKKKQTATVCAMNGRRKIRRLIARLPLTYSSAGRVSRVVLYVVLLILAGCVSVGDWEEGKSDIRVSKDLRRVTIRARSVSRASILETLRIKYLIEIRPQNLEDEIVTVDIVNVSLEEAVRRLLPKGTHYALRTGDRELAVPGVSTRRKKGKPWIPPGDLPTKGKTSPLPDDKRVHIKVDPEKWKPPRPKFTEGLKLDPVKVAKVPVSKGRKKDKAVVAPVTVHVIRLRFHISSDNTVRLQHAARMEGSLPRSTIVRGNFLFALRNPNGTVVHFGSFADPLEMHCYNEDGTHDVMRAQEGSFGLWIPDSPKLPDLALEIYDASNVTLPTELDQKSLMGAVRKAKRIALIKGKVLKNSINGS